jgi:tetratricopeptide (TPR) repeat protein
MGHIGKSTFRRCVWVGFFVLLINSVVIAQKDERDSPGALLKESIRLIDAGKYSVAIEKMQLYLDLVEESTADRVVAIAQDIRFKLATILITEDRLDEASEVLEKYISLRPCKSPRQGMKMLATCYYEMGKPETPEGSPNAAYFKKCVEAIENALDYNENPVVVASAVAMDGGRDDSVLKSGSKVDEDPEYTQDELVLLHLTLGEALYGLKRWAECIDPFTYVIEKTPDDLRKGFAIMFVVNALIEIPDFARITEWIPQLYRTDARFDIRVNQALMNAAAALYTAKEYDSALPLYRMILPRDEVIAYQQERLRKMRLGAGLTPEQGMAVSKDEMLLFGVPDEAEKQTEATDAEAEPEGEKTPREILDLERLIAALEALPPYENNIDYRMAQLYQRVDRYWEAVRFFDKVYAMDSEGDLGERAIVDVITVLLEDLKEVEEAKKRGFDYMGKYKEGFVPRQVAYIFTAHYQKTKSMEETKALLPYINEFVRTNDTTILEYDGELYFMQAVADLMLYNYEASEKGFKRVLDEFPESRQKSNALYWYGASKLYMQKYEEALPIFEQYISQFPTGDWIDEAYFQGGVALFGMEKYVEARERFTQVIDTFPDSTVYPNACSMRGDLYGADGLLDDAIDDYNRAIAAAVVLGNVKQATYATFKMAEVYEADAEASGDPEYTQAKYNALVECVQSYLDTWDAEADIAKALYWIGKTKIQLELVDEAVSTYLDAIVRFGTDVQQDGVDMMIAELVKVSAIWLGIDEQTQLMEDLQTALESTDNIVLQLRLRVTMAKLDYSEIELGKRLIKELPDLKNASPPILAAICDASFEMKDYSRAKELLNIFITRVEESDYMRAAYKLRAFGQYDEKDFEGALATIEEAQETYGHDRDVVWAQLMRAQILLDEGNLNEAREANMYVINIPGWRGEPVAQATFQLGQVEEKAGNTRKAFGFYQRTYVQYKGYSGGYWAAESYLASARCLQALGLEEDRVNTYKRMLFDTYVNDLPQADVARKELGASEVTLIETYLDAGGSSNLVIEVDFLEKDMVDTTLSKTTEEAAATETDKAVDAEAEPSVEEPSEPEMNMDEPSETETNATDAVGTEGNS